MYGPPSTSTSSSSSPVPTAVSEQPCFRIDDLLDLTNVDIVDDSDPHHNYADPPFIPHHHHHLHYNDFNNVVDLCVPVRAINKLTLNLFLSVLSLSLSLSNLCHSLFRRRAMTPRRSWNGCRASSAERTTRRHSTPARSSPHRPDHRDRRSPPTTRR